MKHADATTLDQIEDVLGMLRQLPSVKERKRGIFYRKSKAFIHFHADGEDIYADARLSGEDFTRFPVTTSEQRAAFLTTVRSQCESPALK